ncbi:hypothetical protein ACFU8I_40925, partial [Streptomyces sp. NPDC057540]|uniref:hypothetical protein n=1 Tax=Streptomyces sp. NPDC057540 TaxID=3346160 RepID=UPI0036AFE1E3
MADITVEGWAGPVLGALGGQPWPQASESELVARSEAAEALAESIVRVRGEFEADALGAVRTMSGMGAEALDAAVRSLLVSVPVGLREPVAEALVGQARELADSTRRQAVQVETA